MSNQSVTSSLLDRARDDWIVYVALSLILYLVLFFLGQIDYVSSIVFGIFSLLVIVWEIFFSRHNTTLSYFIMGGFAIFAIWFTEYSAGAMSYWSSMANTAAPILGVMGVYGLICYRKREATKGA